MACFKCFYNSRTRKISKKITQKTFADYVAFQNQVQKQQKLAIKLLEDIFIQKDNLKKIEFYVLNNSFHGRTLATIFASNRKKT